MNVAQKQLLGWGTVWLAGLACLGVMLPGLLVKQTNGGASSSSSQHSPAGSTQNAIAAKEQPLLIPVYLSKQQTIETVPLEDYVRGVVAAELPGEFELEAMKAQALAARTYMVRRIVQQDFSNVPVQNAWVTDSIAHQAYLSEDELRRRETASPEGSLRMERLNRAVLETKDLMLTYDGKPINATFFSTSNGYTENSEDYWGDNTPYLRSMPSPWDAKLSPRYNETVTFSYKELLNKLGVRSISSTAGRSTSMKVISWTDGHRVKTISIGGKVFTGKDVREKLGLNSTQFTWTWRGSQLDITMTGFGHGVGMSQWGANGMAKEGKTAEQIVKYYYKDISIDKVSSYFATKS